LGISFPDNLYILVFGTTISWLTITFLTKPEPEEKLLEFYTRVKPGGALWRSVSSKYGLSNESSGMKYQFLGWISGTVMIYSLLFGSGSLIFGDYSGMFFYLIFIILGIVGVIFSLSKTTV
jgi:hypothetical protein